MLQMADADKDAQFAHTRILKTPPPVTREVFQVGSSVSVIGKYRHPNSHWTKTGTTTTYTHLHTRHRQHHHLVPPSSLTTNTGNSARNWVQSVMKTLRCIRAVYPPPIRVKVIIGHISMQSLKYILSRYITPGKQNMKNTY